MCLPYLKFSDLFPETHMLILGLGLEYLGFATWPQGYKTVTDSLEIAMIGCLQTRVRKQPSISLYFEFETLLKFYNLETGHPQTSLLRYRG